MLLTQLNDWSSSFGRSFIYILVLILLMFLAFYVTRFLSVKIRGYSGGNIKVIEGIGVGNNGSVVLIKAGSKFVLLGVTKERVSYLTELESSDIEAVQQAQPKKFETYLSNLLKGKKDES